MTFSTPDLPDARTILQAHPLFAELASSDLDTLLNACESATFLPGEPLWTADQALNAAYILLAGRVELTRHVQPDGLRTLQVSQPGTLLAQSSLVQSLPLQGTARALEKVKALRLPRAAFDALFAKDAPAAYILIDAIAESLVQDMHDTNRRLHDVFGQPAETLRTLRRRIHKT